MSSQTYCERHRIFYWTDKGCPYCRDNQRDVDPKAEKAEAQLRTVEQELTELHNTCGHYERQLRTMVGLLFDLTVLCTCEFNDCEYHDAARNALKIPHDAETPVDKQRVLDAFLAEPKS